MSPRVRAAYDRQLRATIKFLGLQERLFIGINVFCDDVIAPQLENVIHRPYSELHRTMFIASLSAILLGISQQPDLGRLTDARRGISLVRSSALRTPFRRLDIPPRYRLYCLRASERRGLLRIRA
jgi:hypothetical protein